MKPKTCVAIFKTDDRWVMFWIRWTQSAISFCLAQQPNGSQGRLILEVSRTRTVTHHRRWDVSGEGIGPSQRPLSDNRQHSQQTDILAPGGVRTDNLSKRVAADPRLWPLGLWDQLCRSHSCHISPSTFFFPMSFYVCLNAQRVLFCHARRFVLLDVMFLAVISVVGALRVRAKYKLL